MLYAICHMNILGVRIDNLSKKEILEKVEFFLNEEKFHQVATVNPEFVLEAQGNPQFKAVLNQTALNVADGVGIWYAFLRFGKNLKTRLAGADLLHEILQKAEAKNLSVFLAVNKNGLSSFEEIKTALWKKYPKLEISGQEFEPSAPIESQVVNCELVFCNFGAPSQEIFLNSLKNDTIKLAMGVGGAFDFLTGKRKRAPKIMRKFGLEWLWRFMLEPKYRINRIINAAFVFPIKVLLSKNSNERL